MPTYIGESKIVDRYLGDKFLEAAYIGDKKVYDPYTEITGYLPMLFKSRATVALKNYRINGITAGAGVETENLVDVSFFTNNYTLNTDTGLPEPTQLVRICTISPINVSNTNTVTLSWNTEIGFSRALYSIFNNGTLIKREANVGNNTAIDVSSANEIYICLYTLTVSDVNYVMLTKGSTPPDHYIPYGYKLPLTVESGVTENLWDGNYEHAVLSGFTSTEFKFVTSINGRTAIIPCEPNTTYTIKKYSESNRLLVADSINRPNNEDICELLINSTSKLMKITVTTHADAHWMSIYVSTSSEQAEPNITVTKGSTPPDHYIPHRYTSDIPIYIGDSKLGEEDYVDFGEQKIYKMSEGTLVPADPPLPLPPIPTYKGENTLSSTETLGEVTVKGRIAPMYHQVEYLKSTGTQYIDTDIIPTYSTKTELDVKFSDIVASADNDHSYFFGISGASVLGVYNALLQRRTSNDVEDIGVYDGFYYSAGGISLLKNLSIKTRSILTINRPTSSWDSTTVSTDKAITAVTPTVGLCIFGLKAISDGQQVFLTQTSRNMFLYECKIYLDGSTVSNYLIPVERYDGVLGLYDKITGKFYVNAGTGTFEGGPPIT